MDLDLISRLSYTILPSFPRSYEVPKIHPTEDDSLFRHKDAQRYLRKYIHHSKNMGV